MRFILLGIMALACAPNALGQVYKCKGKSGEPVYQQQPCSPDSKPIPVRGTKAATRTQGEDQTRTQVFRATDLSDAAIAERSCMNGAQQSIYGPSDARISGYRDQIAKLNGELSLVRNNLAGATLASGLHTQISGLQNAIATEQAAAAQQMTVATQRCADARRAREKAIEERYAPSPAKP